MGQGVQWGSVCNGAVCAMGQCVQWGSVCNGAVCGVSECGMWLDLVRCGVAVEGESVGEGDGRVCVSDRVE